jgi:glutathione S-transferase
MKRAITLYSFVDGDRSGKVRWTARELGYEVTEERVAVGQQNQPDYLGINPYGQIPAARLDGTVLIESTAICLSLAERHPESGLIPADGSVREAFWQAACVATQTLEFPVATYFLSKNGVADPAWAGLLEERVRRKLRTFADQTPAGDYWLGAFTLVDIFAAYCLRIGVTAGLLEFEGTVGAYLERLMQRPAAQQARFFDALKSRA